MKRGAYNKSVVTVDGDSIQGLKRRPNRGRFYAKDETNSTFGDDPVAAFVRFAQWRWEQRQPKGISEPEAHKLPCWFPVNSSICPEIAAAIRNACGRLEMRDVSFALGLRERELRKIAVEAVRQMDIFEIADLLGIKWSKLRNVAVEQAADDPSSTSKMPAAFRKEIESHATGFRIPDGFFDSMTQDQESRRQQWDRD